MKTDLVIKKDLSPSHIRVNSSLSFTGFLKHVQDRILVESTVKKNFYRYILDQFEKHPEWKNEIDTRILNRYDLLFELVYASLFAPLNDDETVLWGLGLPMHPTTFYNTESLHSLLKDGLLNNRKVSLIQIEDDKVRQMSLGMAYSHILQKVYNVPIFQRNQIIQAYRDEETGLTKYLQVNIDLRFVSVKINGDLPELKMELPSSGNFEDCTMESLQKNIPLSAFHFEGFSVITAIDATEDYIMGNIRSTIADHNPEQILTTFSDIFKLFQSLIGTNKISFGALPFLEVNQRLVSPYANHPFSFLMNAANDLSIPEKDVLAYLDSYRQNPKFVFYSEAESNEEKSFITAILHQRGIKTFALMPIFHSNSFVGIFEIYSTESGIFNRRSLSNLDHALPLLAQLLHRAVGELYIVMDTIMKEEFTNLQPSVEWKFKEVVWKYMKDCSMEKHERYMIDAVDFDYVYPLYGAIDIRNSTVERSRALKSDLEIHFASLIDTLTKLGDHIPDEKLGTKILQGRKYQELLSGLLTTNDEIMIRHFLEEDIKFLLQEYYSQHPAARKVIAKYFEVANEKSGIAYQNRRRLENSMQLINSCLQQDLEAFQKDLRKIYPSYFESFRTDGIEYDIYLGQSLAPDVLFNRSFLNDYRLKQLSFMANAVKLTNSLRGQMKIPLQTTQLIFVHESTIDINFRKDERRFDVEGSYNIRYQILKKRIDKALIKGTNERLTQPGKIAIVYSSDRSADEYVQYISKLQQEGILAEGIEFVEIEELQGVSGLKGIRVSVNSGEESKGKVLNKSIAGAVDKPVHQ